MSLRMPRLVNLATKNFGKPFFVRCHFFTLFVTVFVHLTLSEKVLLILFSNQNYSPHKTQHSLSANYFLSLLIFKIRNGSHLAPKSLITIRPAADYIAHLDATPDFAGAFIVT